MPSRVGIDGKGIVVVLIVVVSPREGGGGKGGCGGFGGEEEGSEAGLLGSQAIGKLLPFKLQDLDGSICLCQ
jgi:hypothetical protein